MIEIDTCRTLDVFVFVIKLPTRYNSKNCQNRSFLVASGGNVTTILLSLWKVDDDGRRGE